MKRLFISSSFVMVVCVYGTMAYGEPPSRNATSTVEVMMNDAPASNERDTREANHVKCPEGKHTYVTYKDDQWRCLDCDRCERHNQHLVERCLPYKDSVCSCNDGYYYSELNEVCRHHTRCGLGHGVAKPGTPKSDVKCAQCLPGYYSCEVSSVSECKKQTDCHLKGLKLLHHGNATSDNTCGEPIDSGSSRVTKAVTPVYTSPSLHTEPADEKIVTSGDQATITCLLMGPLSVNAAVTWQRDGVTVSTNDDLKIHQIILKHKSLLMFKNFTADDAGAYTCIGTESTAKIAEVAIQMRLKGAEVAQFPTPRAPADKSSDNWTLVGTIIGVVVALIVVVIAGVVIYIKCCCKKSGHRNSRNYDNQRKLPGFNRGAQSSDEESRGAQSEGDEESTESNIYESVEDVTAHCSWCFIYS